MNIGENIKKLRKEKGLTQKQLGALCRPPIDEANIRKYESNKQNPKIETLQKIATALDIQVYDLIDDWNKLSQDEILSDFGKNTAYGLTQKMLEKFQNIESENGMLDQSLLEKELDSIIEITTKAGSINGVLLNAEIKQCMDKMLTLILKLNESGRKEALKRVSELTRLSEYIGVDLNILLKSDKPQAEPPQE